METKKVFEFACEVCGKVDDLLVCTGCRQVRYCCRGHQLADWKRGHRSACKWEKKEASKIKETVPKQPEWYEKIPQPQATGGPGAPAMHNVGVDDAKDPKKQASAILEQIQKQDDAKPLKDMNEGEVLRRGHKHADNENVDKMLQAWEHGAKLGYKNCQFELGRTYLRGIRGTKADKALGISWLTKAAQGGDADSQSELAVCFKTGEGVTQSDKTAFMWAKKAADQGHEAAMLNVGNAFAMGDHVIKDMEMAAQYWGKAAEAGNETGACNYAMACYRGDGVPQDPGKAKDVLMKAAEGGSEPAKEMLKRFGFGEG